MCQLTQGGCGFVHITWPVEPTSGRTTRHLTYQVSQQLRKRVEEIFGWLKTVGMMRKVRHRGQLRVDWNFTFALAAYNLVRIRNITASTV
jgi:hypothetical protein